MKRGWLTVALVASVFGAVFAFLSLDSYLQVHKTGVFEESFCSINEVVNCDIVEASSYSDIKGIPVAGFGLIYYIFVLIFIASARFSKGFVKPVVAFVWWFSGASLIFTFYMAYVSATILSVVCLTCIGMYIVNTLLFISLFFAMGMPFTEWTRFLWGYWYAVFAGKKKGIDFTPKFWIYVAGSLVIFAVGMVFVSSAASNIARPTTAEVEEYLTRFYRQSKYAIKFNEENTPMWGTKGAPVAIVVFSDFMCPFCKVAAFTMKPFLAEFRKNIRLYFLNYPLDSDCNHYMDHQMHPGACLAARATICADRGGKFWPYHDALFRKSGQIDNKMVTSIAKQLGLDMEAFSACLESPETERKLAEDIEAARKIYVTGTPSVFVNDKQLKLWRSPEVVREVVKREIKEAKGAKL